MAGELNSEIWLPVSGYETAYEVSSRGQVRSLDRFRNGRGGAPTRVRGRVLSQRLGGSGYPTVWLSLDGRAKAVSVHRLVAVAFMGVDPSRPEVNHIDGDKVNNSAVNLEWASRGENVAHAYRTVGRRGWKRAA